MTDKKRIILHLDMDHFYTAVEERERPELKSRPVIVGADPKEGKGRGVVHTCNYEARKFGVRSAMPISKAWKLVPDAVYLRPNFELYVKVSNEIMKALRGHGGKFEQWGIDEAFIDITSNVNDYAEAEALAKQIKKNILDWQRLTCSIGVGPNKLVAKVASSFRKPDGLTIVKEGEGEGFLAPLPVRSLLWVGKKTEPKLTALGIKTIGDLSRYDPAILAERFGIMGTQLYLMAHGIDESEVQERSEIKSTSRDVTFDEDTSDSGLVLTTMDRLAEEIHEDLQRQHLSFKTVTVRVRYEHFETHTHGKSLPRHSNRIEDLKKTARELVEPYFKPERKIRLIGIRASNLASTARQKTLFP